MRYAGGNATIDLTQIDDQRNNGRVDMRHGVFRNCF